MEEAKEQARHHPRLKKSTKVQYPLNGVGASDSIDGGPNNCLIDEGNKK